MLKAINARKIMRRYGRQAVLTYIACLLITISAPGTTLKEYRQKIDVVKGFVEQLSEIGASEKLSPHDQQIERQLIEQIGRALPATEKVEWQGGSVETANQWLETQLEAMQNETDRTKRGDILAAVNDRLETIERQIDELEKPATAGPTKDDDKQKLADILKREEYQKAQVKEESLFQKWWREFKEWLDKVFPRPQISPDTASGFGSLKAGLQILIYVVVIGLIGFLLYKFAPFFARRLGMKTKKDKDDRIILGEKIGSDESAASLFDDAELLARSGDLRGAIRKGYIALLCELSDRKVIGLARHKTNRDYLRDVRKRTDLFDNMSGMTINYERNWYGLRPAETQDWEDFRNRYRQTIASVDG